MSEEHARRFSPEVTQNAFEKASSSVDIEDGELRMVTENDHRAVLDFLRDHMFPDEPVSKSLGIELHPDMERLITSVLDQNLSFMAVCQTTGEIMACRIIGIAQRDDNMDFSWINYDRFITMYHFMHSVEVQTDFFNRVGVSEHFDFFGIGTNKNFRHRGLATKLMKAALVFLKELGSDIVWAKGGATSNFSQRMYENLGFEMFLEVKFADYKVDGEVVINNTGEHKSEKVFAKRLDK